MEKKKRIKKFIESDRKDYAQFLNKLEGGEIDFNQKMENSRKKQENSFDQEEYVHEFMDNGIYGELAGQPPYQELDFEQFSFNILKHLAEQEKLVETIEAIESLPRSDRRKELRIRLFDRLKDIDSPYFNEELYYNCYNTMLQARNMVEHLIEEEGYTILTVGFDSFSFIATSEEAEKLRDKINDELDTSSLSLNTYQNAIKFYNIASFQDQQGEWFIRKSTGTDYDNYKVNVVKALRNLDWNKAHKQLSVGMREEENSKKFKEYNRTLTKMKEKLRKKE